jgi:hypothetical protein
LPYFVRGSGFLLFGEYPQERQLKFRIRFGKKRLGVSLLIFALC